jgi:hypothetical protein
MLHYRLHFYLFLFIETYNILKQVSYYSNLYEYLICDKQLENEYNVKRNTLFIHFFNLKFPQLSSFMMVNELEASYRLYHRRLCFTAHRWQARTAEAVSTSETSVSFKQRTWHNIPEDSHLHICKINYFCVMRVGAEGQVGW